MPVLCLLERLREQQPELVDEPEQLGPVDHARSGQRHRAGILDEAGDLLELVDDGVHVDGPPVVAGVGRAVADRVASP